MVWTLPTTTRRRTVWDDMERLQRHMSRLFEPVRCIGDTTDDISPVVDVRAGEDSVLLTAELPGVEPDAIEVTVSNDTVTIRGTRETEELADGESYLRQERGFGTFVRAFTLPFHVDGENVTAEYRHGVLHLTVPRRDADKPKKITVKAG